MPKADDWMQIDHLSDDEETGNEVLRAAGVETLSDDDGDLRVATPPSSNSRAKRPRDRRARHLDREEVSREWKKLRSVVFSKCKCKDRFCREGFRQDRSALDALLQHRVQLLELPKIDSDREVSSLLL